MSTIAVTLRIPFFENVAVPCGDSACDCKITRGLPALFDVHASRMSKVRHALNIARSILYIFQTVGFLARLPARIEGDVACAFTCFEGYISSLFIAFCRASFRSIPACKIVVLFGWIRCVDSYANPFSVIFSSPRVRVRLFRIPTIQIVVYIVCFLPIHRFV